jgi:hypothetical protein
LLRDNAEASVEVVRITIPFFIAFALVIGRSDVGV